MHIYTELKNYFLKHDYAGFRKNYLFINEYAGFINNIV
jgi:hypothetical protein